MIYLVKNNGNQLFITDAVSLYRPSIMDIYLDDELLGNFENMSNSLLYLKTHIDETLLNILIEKEYILKIKSYGRILKEELSQVRDFHTEPINSYKD